MTDELKPNPFEPAPKRDTNMSPCPFCGVQNVTVSCEDFGWGQFKIRRQAWWVQCNGEHCYALQQGSTEKKARDRWNTRVTDDASHNDK